MESGDTKNLFCGSRLLRSSESTQPVGLATHSSPQPPLLSPSMFRLRCPSVKVRRRLVRFYFDSY